MKRALYVATTARLHINVFHLPHIKRLKEDGWIVDVATNGDESVPYVDNEYTISIERIPLKISNLKAIGQLTRIIKENEYDLISCHTPMGGVVARIAAKIAGNQHVLYMAHGFHFYKGGSVAKNLIFYSAEKFLAQWTDCLITINADDYKVAQKFRLRRNGKLYKINGIGVNLNRFKTDADDGTIGIREEINVPEDAFVITNVGELSKNKNQQSAIKALAECNIDNLYLVICGDGPEYINYKNLASYLGITDKVKLLGYRRDIPRILLASDAFIFLSLREGLPVSVIEAMAAGLPVICSNIRGCRDLIENNKGGILLDDQSASDSIKYLYKNIEARIEMGKYNIGRVEKFDIDHAVDRMIEIIGNMALNERG